jgi:hypothetical protein
VKCGPGLFEEVYFVIAESILGQGKKNAQLAAKLKMMPSQNAAKIAIIKFQNGSRFFDGSPVFLSGAQI